MEWHAPDSLRLQGFDPEMSSEDVSLFTLDNGVQRVTAYLEEGTHHALTAAGCFLDGLFPGIPCADWLFLRISVNGAHLMLEDVCPDHTRTLDLRTGVYTRRYALTLADGTRVTAQFERVLGSVRRAHMAQRITLAADRPAMLSLNLGVDGNVTGPDGSCPWEQVACRTGEDRAALCLRPRAGGQAVSHLFTLRAPAAGMALDIDRRVVFGINDVLRPGVPYVLERAALNRPGEAPDLNELDGAPGLDALAQENAAQLDRFWQAHPLPAGEDPARAAALFRRCLRGEI